MTSFPSRSRTRPWAGCHGFIAVHRATRPARHDAFTEFEVRCKDPVKAGEVQPGSGHQGGQAGDEVEGFQHAMGRSIPERMFVAVNDLALAINTEAFGGGIICEVSAYSKYRLSYLKHTLIGGG